MQLAYIREEVRGNLWVDLYNVDAKQNFPLRNFKTDRREAMFYAQNINFVLGCLSAKDVIDA